MKKQYILILFLLASLSTSVLAHDGSDHNGELEAWVSGIGIIVIIIACIYSLWWKNPDRKKSPKKPERHNEQQI